MDIEAAAKQVPALLQFKQRLEGIMALFEGGGAGSSPFEDLFARIDGLRKDLDELAEHVTSVQQRLDGMTPPTLDTVMLQLKDELTPALQPILDEIGEFKSMATWFAENREGLEVLLSIDGIPDQPAVIEGNVSTDGDVTSAAGETSGAGEQSAPAPRDEPAPAPDTEQPQGSNTEQPQG